MAKSEDKKQVLSDALLEMLDTVPLDQITVSSLVRACGLSRQTFYYHFQTLDELIDWTLHQEISKVVAPIRGEGHLTRIQAVLERTYEQRDFVEKIARYSDSSGSLDEILKQEAGIFVMRNVEEAAVGLDIAPQDRALIARFYTAGLLEIIRIWIDDGMRETPERLTERLGLFLVNSSDILARFTRDNNL